MRGLVHFKSGEWQEAARTFDLAAQSGAENNPFKIWAVLYKGYASDAMGHREDALLNYRTVLKARPRWKSRDYARARNSPIAAFTSAGASRGDMWPEVGISTNCEPGIARAMPRISAGGEMTSSWPTIKSVGH